MNIKCLATSSSLSSAHTHTKWFIWREWILPLRAVITIFHSAAVICGTLFGAEVVKHTATVPTIRHFPGSNLHYAECGNPIGYLFPSIFLEICCTWLIHIHYMQIYNQGWMQWQRAKSTTKKKKKKMQSGQNKNIRWIYYGNKSIMCNLQPPRFNSTFRFGCKVRRGQGGYWMAGEWGIRLFFSLTQQKKIIPFICLLCRPSAPPLGRVKWEASGIASQ